MKQARVKVDSLYFIDKNTNIVPIATLTVPSSVKRNNLARIGFNFSIDSFDILHKTTGIGKNIPIWETDFTQTLNAGHCGKDGEWSPTSSGGAYLMFEDLMLTKNELDAPRPVLFF